MGGGIWMGNTCKPMVVSFQCMTKFITNKKKKKPKKKQKMKDANIKTSHLISNEDKSSIEFVT